MDVEEQFQREMQVCVHAPVWSYVPVKRCFHPEDPFFEEGELYCNISRQKLDNSEELEDLIFERADFQCDVPGCGEWFSNVPSYEAHYNSLHRHSCQKCKRSFPSTHLLEIHVLENHDTLFSMIATTRNLYRCLVESCPDRFSSEKDRKEHLVSHHKYPADFRFNRPTRKQQKSKSFQFTQEAMDTSCLPKKSASEVSTAQRKILPKTICFGRGSTKAFQKDFSKHDKNKKKLRKKMENSTQYTCEEVTMSEIS